MNIHYFQHAPFEGLYSIEAYLIKKGHSVSVTRFYDNDPLPDPENMDWLIVMGGSMNIHEEADFPWLVKEKQIIQQAIGLNKKVLGICLGAQLIADALGAKVHKNRHPEIGWFPITRSDAVEDSFLAGVFPREFELFHWHGYTFDIPEGALPIGSSPACANQGFVKGDRVVGLQFHPEVTAAAVETFVADDGDALVPSLYVQSKDQLLAGPEQYMASERIMHRVLAAIETI